MNKFYFTIIAFIILSGWTACKSTSTKLDSDDYENKTKRIEILRKEISCFSDFQDAEFELFNVNGFNNERSSVPGSSSCDYKFVIRIDTLNISKWTIGMEQTTLSEYDDNWTKEIHKQRKQNWKTISEPKYFIRKDENVVMIIYKNEGIIFKSVINQ